MSGSTNPESPQVESVEAEVDTEVETEIETDSPDRSRMTNMAVIANTLAKRLFEESSARANSLHTFLFPSPVDKGIEACLLSTVSEMMSLRPNTAGEMLTILSDTSRCDPSCVAQYKGLFQTSSDPLSAILGMISGRVQILNSAVGEVTRVGILDVRQPVWNIISCALYGPDAEPHKDKAYSWVSERMSNSLVEVVREVGRLTDEINGFLSSVGPGRWPRIGQFGQWIARIAQTIPHIRNLFLSLNVVPRPIVMAIESRMDRIPITMQTPYLMVDSVPSAFASITEVLQEINRISLNPLGEDAERMIGGLVAAWKLNPLSSLVATRFLRFAQAVPSIGAMFGAGKRRKIKVRPKVHKRKGTRSRRYEIDGSDGSAGSAGSSWNEGMEAIYGGASGGLNAARTNLAEKFGKTFFGLVEDMATTITSLASDTSKVTLDFFASSSATDFIRALERIEIKSRAYVPVLCRFYRTNEAQARSEKYVAALTSLIEYIPSLKDLGSNAKAKISHVREAAMKMRNAIESAVRAMDAIFIDLARGKVDFDDGPLSRGEGIDIMTAEPSGIYVPEMHKDLIRSIDDLREAVKRSSTRKGILDNMDKLDEYLAKGTALNKEAVKERIDHLKLMYNALLAGLTNPDVKRLAQRFIDFKISAHNQFYQTLLDTEEILAKRFKQIALSAGMRDAIWRALSRWMLSVHATGTVQEKLREDARILVEELYSGDALTYVEGGTDGPAFTVNSISSVDFFDKLVRNIQTYMLHNTPLRLLFTLIGILEKELGSPYDSEKAYRSAIHYIIASSIDLCSKTEATGEWTAKQLVEKRAVLAIVAGDGSIELPTTGISNPHDLLPAGPGGAVRSVETREHATGGTDKGLYIRHALGTTRVEDILFGRWLEALLASLMLAMDQDRSRIESGKKQMLPGAERLLLGGGSISEPLGLVGSRHVIPEWTPLYRGIPAAAEAYRVHLSWKKDEGKDADEPQLVAYLPRSSRFHGILELVRGVKSESDLSDGHISRIVAAVNEIADHYATVEPDPKRRVDKIFDAFFEEINANIMTMTALQHAEMEEAEKSERNRDALNGIVPFEERIDKLSSGETGRKIKRRLFDALKSISRSVFDIVTQAHISEESLGQDYKHYIEKLQERIEATPDPQRFDELVNSFKKKGETVGDAQGIFTAFSELVVTPLFELMGCMEKFVWRSTNLYMQITRALYSTRVPIWGIFHNRAALTSNASGVLVTTIGYGIVDRAKASDPTKKIIKAGADTLDAIVDFLLTQPISIHLVASLFAWYRAVKGGLLDANDIKELFDLASKPLPPYSEAAADLDANYSPTNKLRTNSYYIVLPMTSLQHIAMTGAAPPVELLNNAAVASDKGNRLNWLESGAGSFGLIPAPSPIVGGQTHVSEVIQKCRPNGVTIGQFVCGISQYIHQKAIPNPALTADENAILTQILDGYVPTASPDMAAAPIYAGPVPVEEFPARLFGRLFSSVCDPTLPVDSPNGAHSSHAEKLKHVYDLLAKPSPPFPGLSVPHTSMGRYIGQASIREGSLNYGKGYHPIDGIRGMIRLDGEYFRLPCYPAIRKAMQLMLIPGESLIDFDVKYDKWREGMGEEKNAGRRVQLNAEKFKAKMQDSMAIIRGSLSQFMPLSTKEKAEAYFQELNGWDIGAMIDGVVEKVNRALNIVNTDSACAIKDYMPNAVVFAVNPDIKPDGHGDTIITDGRWRVNFRRNSLKKEGWGPKYLTYLENARDLHFTGQSFAHIHRRVDDYTEEHWGTLDNYHEAFAPLMKISGKQAIGSGCLPWSSDDTAVIENGWTANPASVYVSLNPAPNSAVLMTPTHAPPSLIDVSRFDTDTMHLGGTNVISTAATVPIYTSPLISGFDDPNNTGTPLISALGVYPGEAIAMSGIYGRPSRDSLAEALNRLIAKTVAALTIRGERPVVAFELASSLMSKTTISNYFATKDTTVPSLKTGVDFTYTFFPNTIGTPMKYEDAYLMYTDGLNVVSRYGTDFIKASPRIEAKNTYDEALGAAGSVFSRAGITGPGVPMGTKPGKGVPAVDTRPMLNTLYSPITQGRSEDLPVLRGKLDTIIHGFQQSFCDISGVILRAPITLQTKPVDTPTSSAENFRYIIEGLNRLTGIMDKVTRDPNSVSESLIQGSIRDFGFIISFIAEIVIRVFTKGLLNGGSVTGGVKDTDGGGNTIIKFNSTYMPTTTAPPAGEDYGLNYDGKALVIVGYRFPKDLLVYGANEIDKTFALFTGESYRWLLPFHAISLPEAGTGSNNKLANDGLIRELVQPFVLLLRSFFAAAHPDTSEKTGQAIKIFQNAGIDTASTRTDLAPLYKPGTFLYDTSVYPFYWSVNGTGTKKYSEMTTQEAARYEAAIPNLIRCFKHLGDLIDLDMKLVETLTDENNDPAFTRGSILVGTCVAGKPAANASYNQYTSLHDMYYKQPPMPTEVDRIPGEMKRFVQAMIDSLTSTYNSVREKFGIPMNMELSAGEFTQYMVGDKFNPTKIMTPLSYMAGTAMCDEKGPLIASAFAEPGWEYGEVSRALSWASPIGLEKEFHNLQSAPMEQLPWSTYLSERLQKIMGSQPDKALQTSITNTARLFNISNGWDLQALALHNPFGFHSVPSSIFHIRLPALSLATLETGVDIIRRLSVADSGKLDTWAAFEPGLIDAIIGVPGMAVDPPDNPEWVMSQYLPQGATGAVDSRQFDLIPATDALVGRTTLAAVTTITSTHLQNRLGNWARVSPAVFLQAGKLDASSVARLYSTKTIFTFSDRGTISPIRIITPERPSAPSEPSSLPIALAPGAVASVQMWFGAIPSGDNNPVPNLSVASVPTEVILSYIEQSLRPLVTEKAEDRPTTTKYRRILEKSFHTNKLPPRRSPGYGAESTPHRIRKWIDLRKEAKDLIKGPMGYKPVNDHLHGSLIEMTLLSPPKTRWNGGDTDTKFRAGLFSYYKRNPISPMTILNLAPFPAVFSFSEAFRLYVQVTAWKEMTKEGHQIVRAHLPMIADLPEFGGSHRSFYSNSPDAGWILSNLEHVTDLTRKMVEEQPEKRKVLSGGKGPLAWDVMIPPRSNTALSSLLDVAANRTDQVSLLVPKDINHQLASFPLFAEWMKVIDYMGQYAKNEMAIRMRERTIEPEDSLLEKRDATIELLS